MPDTRHRVLEPCLMLEQSEHLERKLLAVKIHVVEKRLFAYAGLQ
jgi:hypothetical protein